MATPSSGPISLNDVNVELGNPGTTLITLNDTAVRGLAGAPFSTPGTTISLNDLRGKSSQIPVSYYPTSNPAAVTTASDVTGFTISTEGEYIMTVSAPFNAPFIMWGAGGSRGNDNGSGGGGAGGSSSGTLALTSGTTYRIVVGGQPGVQVQFASPFGSGGPGGGPTAFGGAGGGYTALFVSTISQADTRLMAGGGGGGNGTDAGNQPSFVTGGAGGGPSGQPGNPGGFGGGQTIPGSFQGGTGGTRGVNQGSGGGGGGGFNGGAGGGVGGGGTAGQSGYPGGGGSGYIHPSVVGGSTVGGDRTTAGNAPSPYRGTAGNPGTIGRFVMLPKT